MDLVELAPAVYACMQEDRGLGTSNSGLLNRAGGLVVDTFWDLPHTRDLIATYARVWSGPARRVVNTHNNGDHCWGNQLFPGAEIIGHRMCAENFAKENPRMLQALRDATGSSEPAVADIAAQLADWDFSGIELHLIWVGPAHTAGDLIVHLPRERIVFTGDVLFRLCTPIGWEGTSAQWVRALDTIVALRPAVIVPGHGPLCGVEGPREMRDYLQYVRREAEQGFADGLPALEAAKRIDPGPYARWTAPERMLSIVQRAYRELRGEPMDAPIDVAGLFRGMYELRQAQQARHSA